MPPFDAVSIDLIQELRLRKWAREHYVAKAERGRHWHPVVLEEMQFRDEELQTDGTGLDLPCSPYVPLAPLETYLLDEPHDAVPEPKSLAILTGGSEALELETIISSSLSDRHIRR